jgi:hypothetical protein
MVVPDFIEAGDDGAILLTSHDLAGYARPREREPTRIGGS